MSINNNVSMLISLVGPMTEGHNMNSTTEHRL